MARFKHRGSHRGAVAQRVRAGSMPPCRRLMFETLERRDLLAVSLVSTSIVGGSGNRPSTNGVVSQDGRYVVFESTADNLVANDFNNPTITDIFRRDLQTGQTVLVSVNTAGNGGGNNHSTNPVISADGRYVAFVSAATDLVLVPDNNGFGNDIFIRDLLAGTTTIVSRSASILGTANGISGSPSISSDGRFVAFHSTAFDLVAPGVDTNGATQDVFVWDMANNGVTLLSVPFTGFGSGNAPSSNPVISGNGQVVTFVSNASDLYFNDTNGNGQDVFARNITGGSVELISISTTAGTGSNTSASPSISDDGRFVAFTSLANNLVFNDPNNQQDVFVRDRMAGVTQLVSVDFQNALSANGPSDNPIIARSGRAVAYTSTASNLVINDTNGSVQDVFVRDLLMNFTHMVSTSVVGGSGTAASFEPAISADGRFVAFTSTASNLVLNDTNGALQDVFRRDLSTGTTELVSTNVSGTGSGNSNSFRPRISNTGGQVVFGSTATDLVFNDTNLTFEDVFLFVPSLSTSPQSIVTGPDRPFGPQVRVLDAGTLQERYSFFAYNPAFGGGVRVATADVNGDGVADIITAPGPGGGPHIRVFDGANPGQQLPGAIGSFFAYNPNFTGGVFVAAGDFDGDNRADIVTGAGAGGGPHVRIFSGATGQPIGGYFAYPATFTGGVSVAVGAFDGGAPDVIVGPGPGSVGPLVRVFSGATGSLITEFFAYNPAFGGGVFVSAGNANGDSFADIFTGAGAGGGPHVRVFNGPNAAPSLSFFAFNSTFTGGVRVGSVDANGDGRIDILASSGPGQNTLVRAFSGANSSLLVEGSPYPGFAGGAYVAGTVLTAPFGSPLRATGETSSAGQGVVIDQAALEQAAGGALGRLTAFVPADVLDRIATVPLEVTDLPGDLLGLATADRILLDRDAAGRGWFVDPTPADDEEFTAGIGGLVALDPRAADAMDLLTVLIHEFGHVLGMSHADEDSPAGHVMLDRLTTGTRRTALEALDRLFAGESL